VKSLQYITWNLLGLGYIPGGCLGFLPSTLYRNIGFRWGDPQLVKHNSWNFFGTAWQPLASIHSTSSEYILVVGMDQSSWILCFPKDVDLKLVKAIAANTFLNNFRLVVPSYTGTNWLGTLFIPSSCVCLVADLFRDSIPWDSSPFCTTTIWIIFLGFLPDHRRSRSKSFAFGFLHFD